MSSRFLYRANALAVGGRITAPDPAVVLSQGSAVLPIVGGRSFVECRGFRLGSLIAFECATSEVLGSQPTPGGPYETVSQVSIEGLDIGSGVITADRVVARLVSTHTGSGESRIVPTGSYFANLRIAGRSIEHDDHTALFAEHDTFDKVVDQASRRNEVLASVVDTPGWQPGKTPPPRDTVQVAIVGGLRADGLKLNRNCVTVPGFGRVFLGELFVQRDSRRLTMIRVELGSPEKGAIVANAVETDGHDYP